MKARIPSSSLLNSNQRRRLKEETQKLAKEHVDSMSAEMFRRYMMLTAITLNESHGFGKDRMTKVFDQLNELVQGHAPEDIIFWEHVERRCKQLGLSVYLNLEG